MNFHWLSAVRWLLLAFCLLMLEPRPLYAAVEATTPPGCESLEAVDLTPNVPTQLFRSEVKPGRTSRVALLIPGLGFNAGVFCLGDQGGLAGYLQRQGIQVYLLEPSWESLTAQHAPKALSTIELQLALTSLEHIHQQQPGKPVAVITQGSSGSLLFTPELTRDPLVNSWTLLAPTLTMRYPERDLRTLVKRSLDPSASGTLWDCTRMDPTLLALFSSRSGISSSECQAMKAVISPLNTTWIQYLDQQLSNNSLFAVTPHALVVEPSVLIIAGQGDRISRPEDIQYVLSLFPSAFKSMQYLLLSRANLYPYDYGHLDLLNSTISSRNVYRRIKKHIVNS